MPTFSYKGYDFEVDHTPSEEEFGQMSAYVDTLPPKQETPKKREASWMESLAQGAGQVGNTADLALSTLAGGAAALFGDDQNAPDIEEQRLARKQTRDQWGSPQETQMSFPQKAINILNPASLLTSGLSPAQTVDTALRSGETTGDALKAGAVDAAGNIVGMVLPGFKQGGALVRAGTGAAANIGQEYVTRKTIQDMLKTEQGKAAFEVTSEDLALAGLAGGGMATLAGRAPKPSKTAPKGINALASLDALAEAKKTPVADAPVTPEQLRLFDQFEERSPISPYQTEMAPDMWRVDENGIPIRADLSMEVQNLQQPLQRNLFGDELDVNFPRDPNRPLPLEGGDITGAERFSDPVNFRNDPENQIPLTEAIDSMDPVARSAALEQTAMGRELPASPDLEVARMDAELRQWLDVNDQPKNAMAAKFSKTGRAKKQGGGLLIGDKKVTVEATEDGFIAKMGDKEVGRLRSNITPEQRAQLGETANVDIIKVDDAVKGKGVGAALYDAWTKANNGEVAPSGKTSTAAWKVWKRDNPTAVDKFVNQEAGRIADGADESMVLGNITDPEVREKVSTFNLRKQSGGVLFDWKKQPELDQLSKVAGIREKLSNFIPSDMTPDAVVDAAKGMKDVDQNVAQRAINTFTKGGLYQAEKTNNPIIKFTVDKVLAADRLARADVRDYIHDSLAPAMRDLSKAEMTEIVTVLNHADKVQVPVTPEFLRQQGFSEKQVAFAEAHRQTMDASFEAINKARTAAGMEPISKRVAYAAMNFTGDYRKLVYTLDGEGNKTVVGAIGAKTVWGLKSIEKRLKAENPSYVVETGKPRYIGGNSGEKGGSAVLAVQQALSLLAENDPNTKAFLDVMEQIKTAEAYDYLNTKSHTKAKKGVFGAEGRKPWESAEQNAKDFMDAQLQYAEAALKWGHLSEAANEVKQVLSSDVDMPNAKQWSEGYLQNALGINPSATGRAFEKAVNQFWESSGIGRTIPAKAQMYSRKAVNTMLLGLNPGFLAANLVQPMLSLPAMTTFLKGRGIDALTTGYDNTFKAGLTLFKEKVGKLSDLEQAAVKYAEDNHVFGSDLVDTSNISRKNAEFYLDKTGNFLASNVESGTRKLVYYTFVHMLNDNGLGRDFGLAQNLTDIAMNNYSPVERPQVFNALGPVGDLAANLSSFKHNELSRLAMFAREVGKDANAAPFLMQVATQVAAAGMTGTIAFAEADWLYRQITKALGAPDSLSRVVIDFSEGLTENAKGKYLASHGIFSALGIDMSKRLGISDVIPDSLPEAMFPGGSKLVDVGAAGLSAMGNPDELNLKRFAREAAPGVATGPMDRAWFSKQTPQGELAINRRTLEGQVIRNEADKMAKNIGFTGINESVQKQKLYDLKQQGIGYQELRDAVFKKMTNQMFTTGKIDPRLIENYVKYEGDLGTLETSLEAYAKKSNASMVDLAKLRAVAARSLPQQKQGQRVMEAFNE